MLAGQALGARALQALGRGRQAAGGFAGGMGAQRGALGRWEAPAPVRQARGTVGPPA